MESKAIVYTSNTGYTAEYANMLGGKIGLPAYSFKEAEVKLPKGEAVIYLGWIIAGQIKNYNRALQKYKISAVCGVGMSTTGSKIQDTRKLNNIPNNIPLFTLQGGFELKKLKGIYKFMMKLMSKTLVKSITENPDKTPEDDVMLNLLLNGGSCVCKENLQSVVDWYNNSVAK